MAHFQRQTEHEVNSIFFHYPVYNLAKDNNLRFSFVKNQAKRIQSIDGLHKCTPRPHCLLPHALYLRHLLRSVITDLIMRFLVRCIN